MSRADAIRSEMRDAVRLLGSGEAGADRQNSTVSRLTGLSVTTVQRLRWRKIKRVPGDIVDTVREAAAAYNGRAEKRAAHVISVMAARAAALEAWVDQSSDPEFLRAQAAGFVEQARQLGLLDRPMAKTGGTE